MKQPFPTEFVLNSLLIGNISSIDWHVHRKEIGQQIYAVMEYPEHTDNVTFEYENNFWD